MVRRLVIMALLAAAAWGIWYYLRGDERQVRGRLSELARLVSKEGEEPVVAMALRMKRLGTLFAPLCRIESDRHGLFGELPPDRITSHAAAGRAPFRRLSLAFHDVGVRFPREGEGVATATAVLSGVTKAEDLFEETHEVEIGFVKGEGGWRVSRLRAVEVLRR